MTFHSILSTFLSSVATFLQYLRIDFSNHNLHVMPDNHVVRRFFCTAIGSLQLCFWNRKILQQDWSPHHRNIMVGIMNSWTITVYPSAPREPICSTCHSFPFLFRQPQSCLLMRNSWVFLEKQWTFTLLMQLVHAPVFSGSRVAHYLCCVLCLFFLAGLCPWITFCWSSLEYLFPWQLFQKQKVCFFTLTINELWHV